MGNLTEHDNFKAECDLEIQRQGNDPTLQELTAKWIAKATEYKYSYRFEWLGRPVIQYPQDLIGVQQLLWKVQPDLIIETGIARGGSMIFYASILELIALCGGNTKAMILGVDIDIREHNKSAIMAHPMAKRIEMLQGSSVSTETFSRVKNFAANYKKILVCLDSNHTHQHVLDELNLYGPLVSRGSYCVVFDTIVEDLPENSGPTRPWGKANNPKTAVREYLQQLDRSPQNALDGAPLRWSIDKQIDAQLLITVAPDGFLRRD